MSKILITTFGSLGDIHPFMSLAQELQRRGHQATIATSELYRQKITDEGIGFVAARPELKRDESLPDLMEKVMDSHTGTEFLFRNIIMPSLQESYSDLYKPVMESDLIITHPVAVTAPIVAEKLHKKWISSALCPASLWSIYDPPEISPVPALKYLRKLGPHFQKAILRLAKRITLPWVQEVFEFREKVGLPRGAHPMFEGQHSQWGCLAMFSPLLASRQADWPANTKPTGFCFYDQLGEIALHSVSPQADEAQKLREFLDNGKPPIVFTLGSAAVFTAKDFYQQCLEATIALKQRAVMLVGDRSNLPQDVPPEVFVCDYAPHSELFPKAKLIVHHGGAGTTGQAMRAGKPMLVVPFSHDQPDNAARLERLGVASRLIRRHFSTARAINELSLLIGTSSYAQQAEKMGNEVRRENGPANAANVIEAALETDSPNALK
ncbi:MAG: glycosyltransferase [Abditibacteriaceae bacterium]